VFGLDAVTRANYLPWGSKSMDDLLNTLQTRDPKLLARMFDFAAVRNEMMIERLRPKAMIVPFSLGTNRRLRDFAAAIHINSAPDTREHRIKTPHGELRVFSGTGQRGQHSVTTLYVPHPASLHQLQPTIQ
jgi:hypothetical protein